MIPNMYNLAAIGKIWNGVKYDFPIEACVRSALEGADIFVLVVCVSEDDTADRCRELASKLDGRLVLLWDQWRISPDENYLNMSRLANRAIDHARPLADWFWSIDMDEIIPEGQARLLMDLARTLSPEFDAINVRFNHLYATKDRIVKGKLYDHIVRLARSSSSWRSGSDGCGLNGGKLAYRSILVMNHYGYLRSPAVMTEKEVRFQTELYRGADRRFSLDLPTDKVKYYEHFLSTDDVVIPYGGPPHHPLALEWIAQMERRDARSV